jgi:hypothetical protein
MTFKIVDRPMTCCGMLEASGFNDIVKDELGTRYANDNDRLGFFAAIEQAQVEDKRNCALISLSDDQPSALAQAKQHGYRVVFEFYNPNSGNKVYLLTKLLWEDTNEYEHWRENQEQEEEEPF